MSYFGSALTPESPKVKPILAMIIENKSKYITDLLHVNEYMYNIRFILKVLAKIFQYNVNIDYRINDNVLS